MKAVPYENFHFIFKEPLITCLELGNLFAKPLPKPANTANL
jgi:hypothetical protein